MDGFNGRREAISLGGTLREVMLRMDGEWRDQAALRDRERTRERKIREGGTHVGLVEHLGHLEGSECRHSGRYEEGPQRSR